MFTLSISTPESVCDLTVTYDCLNGKLHSKTEISLPMLEVLPHDFFLKAHAICDKMTPYLLP